MNPTDAPDISFADPFGFELLLAVIALALASLSRRPLGERLGLGPGRLGAAPLGVLVVGTLALSYALDGVWDASGLPRTAPASSFEGLDGAGGRTLLLALLSLAIAPGVAEELLCRGWVQWGLRTRLGAAPSIAIGAAAFGALHGDPTYALFAGVLGAYLGWIAHLSGSIRASMLCHAVNNAAALVAPGGAPATLVGVALGLAFSLGALIWATRRGLQPTAQPDES